MRNVLTSNPRHSSQKVRCERRDMSTKTVSHEMEILCSGTSCFNQLLEEPEKYTSLIYFSKSFAKSTEDTEKGAL